jgi:hypothetical protein
LKDLVIFSICNSNYIRETDILFHSLKRYLTIEFKFIVINVDLEFEVLNSHYEIINTSSIFKDHEIDSFLRSKYNLTEYATSIKPKCFSYFFENGFTDVIYFDPDIELYNDLEYLSEGDFGSYDIFLTSHRTSPCSSSSFLDDIDILQTGTFNFGFLHLRSNSKTNNLAKWWFQMCQAYSFSDLNSGFFTDQYFGNIFISYFKLNIKRLNNTKYNIAYWNIDELDFFDISRVFFIHFSKVNRLNENQIFSYLKNYPYFYNQCLNYAKRDLENKSKILCKIPFRKITHTERLFNTLVDKGTLNKHSFFIRTYVRMKFYFLYPLLKHLSYRKQKAVINL